MVPGFLVLCLAAGILHADRASGGGADPFLGSLALCGLLTLSASLLLQRQVGARGGERSRRPPIAVQYGMAVVVLGAAGLVCFVAGHMSLERRLQQAEVDAARARRAAHEGIRIAEARVSQRRIGVWGDEVTLGDVRAVDGGVALPRRIRLQLAASREREERAPAGRAKERQAEESRARILWPETAPPDPGRAESTRSDDLIWPGARVRLGLRLAPLRGQRNPGAPDLERVEARRGLAARARLAGPEWVVEEMPATDILDRLAPGARSARRALKRRVAEQWSGLHRGSGLARAFAIGDRSGIAREMSEAFRALGLAHLVAVSGLHVGLVAGLAGWLALICLRGRMLKASMPFFAATFVGCGAAVVYAWLTGAGVSVQRAAGLLVLVVGFRVGGRELRPLGALALVAGMMLARDPATLFDLGAQLSFGSCLALWAGGVWTRGGRQESEASSEPRLASRTSASRVGLATAWLVGLLHASLVVSLGTGWILAAHGMSTPWLGPVFNLVAIPWTAFLALPGAMLALAWTAAGTPGGWACELVRILLWPAWSLGEAAEVLADMLPGWTAPGWLHWIPMALLSIVGVGAARVRRWGWALLAWSLIAWAGPAPPTAGVALGSAPRVVFFDVGQGDAALVQGSDYSLLIDTGPGPPDGGGGRRLVGALQALGQRSLDTLVVTHADLDHRGGARGVIDAMSIGELWLPASDRSSPVLASLAEHARVRGARVRWRAAEQRFEKLGSGELSVRILWPPAEAAGLSRNEGSLVLAVELVDSRFLFAADVGVATERALLRSGVDLRAEFLKVSHHGSRRSSSTALLAAVGARLAVLSAPCIATRGLPSPVVLERLRGAGTAVAWTGRDGAIAIEPGDRGSTLGLRHWARPRRCET